MNLDREFMEAYEKMATPQYIQWHGGKVHDQQVLCAMGKDNNYSDFLGEDGKFEIKHLDMTWNYQFNIIPDNKDLEKFLEKDYDVLKKEINFVHFLLSRPWLPYPKWGSANHGMFHSNEFPEFNFSCGYVVNKREKEPRPETRIRFVEDWREEVKEIEDKYDVKLFEEFDSLRNLV